MQWINAAVGFLGGSILAILFVGLNKILKNTSLRSCNTMVLGLFFGYLFSQSALLSLQGAINLNTQTMEWEAFRFFFSISCAYIGLIMTIRTAEEFRLIIPFIEFKQKSHKKKDILVDLSLLSDPRLIDFASSGLLDHQLIIPRFAQKELYTQAESTDEAIKNKARRSLDLIKKLETLPFLDIRYIDNDYPEIKDPMIKLVRLARLLDTHIITSDINRIQQSTIEGVRIINIQMLSNALKPLTQAGESINIKIQRYGKEARQGVGYLEDGTMVVVNGGAEFIGETIKAYVLSVKHTSSGRMIFCNAAEEGCLMSEQHFSISDSDQEIANHKDYLTI